MSLYVPHTGAPWARVTPPSAAFHGDRAAAGTQQGAAAEAAATSGARATGQAKRDWRVDLDRTVAGCASLAEPGEPLELASRLLAMVVPSLAHCASLDWLEQGQWRRVQLDTARAASGMRPDCVASALGRQAEAPLAELQLCSQGVVHRGARRPPAAAKKLPRAGQAGPEPRADVRWAAAVRVGEPVGDVQLTLPIVAAGQLQGVWNLQRQRGQRLWQRHERRLLQLLATQAGVAWATARLHQQAAMARHEADQQARHAAFIWHVSDALNAVHELDEALRLAVRLATSELADAAIIYLEGDQHGRKTEVAHVHPERAQALRRLLQRSPSALRMPAFQGRRRGRLALPLYVRGLRRGHIVCMRHAPRPAFDDAEVQLARALVRRTADTIDRIWLQGELQLAVHVREDFLRMASHELRTPLAALQLQLGSLRRAMQRHATGAPDFQRLSDKVDGSLQQSDRLCQLINNLLEVSKGEPCRLSLRRSWFDLTALCRRLIRRAAPVAAQGGVTLQLRAPGPLPGFWDRARLRKAIAALLTNAIKFGAQKPVTVVLAEVPGHIALQVADRGIGLDARAVPRIFDCFERAVSGRAFGGLGLGLFVARQIILAHGGSICVRSVPNKGARFKVLLPYEAPNGAGPGPGQVVATHTPSAP